MKAKLLAPVLMLAVLLSYASIASAAPSKTDYVKYKTSTRRNRPPVADFSHSTDELTASFTDASYDPDGFVVSWSWSFGDGATSGERNPTHTYPTQGTYEVTLIVTDNAGAADSESKNVTVTLLAPPTPTPSDTPPSSPPNPDFAVSISPPSQPVMQPPTLPQVITVSAGPGPPSMKAYDRGSRYDPLVISYYDMTAAGWDADKAAANVWARTQATSPPVPTQVTNMPSSTPPKSSTPIISLSLKNSTSKPTITSVVSATVSIAKVIISSLLPPKLF